MDYIFKDNNPLIFIIFGILTSTNVMYVLRGQNSYVSILSLLAVLIVAYSIIIKRKVISFKNFDLLIIIYFIVCMLSIIQVLFYINEYPDLFSKYIKGLILLALNINIYIAVIMNPNQKRAIVKGITIGFVVNVVFCIYQYFAFSNNLSFTDLSAIFPQESYGDKFIYYTRVFGFFREPAHMLRFFCGAFILTIIPKENSTIKILILIATGFVLLISTSSLVVIFLIGIAVCYIILILRKRSERRQSRRTFKLRTIIKLLSLICVSAILSLFLFNSAADYLSKINYQWYWDFIFNGTNLQDLSANGARMTAMKNALSLIPHYPFGIGLNGSATLLADYFSGDYVVKGATYNGLLTIMLETGLFGICSYLIIFIENFYKLAIRGRSKYQICLGVALVFSTLCTIMEGGSTFIELIWVLLGLCTIEKNMANSLSKERSTSEYVLHPSTFMT